MNNHIAVVWNLRHEKIKSRTQFLTNPIGCFISISIFQGGGNLDIHKNIVKAQKSEKVVSCKTTREPLTKKVVKIKNCAEGAEHTKTYSVLICTVDQYNLTNTCNNLIRSKSKHSNLHTGLRHPLTSTGSANSWPLLSPNYAEKKKEYLRRLILLGV